MKKRSEMTREFSRHHLSILAAISLAAAGKTGIVLGLAVMIARLPIGRSRSNSVAKRFDETEHRAQRARTGENIAPSRSIRVLAV
jgi:hypothetical protein